MTRSFDTHTQNVVTTAGGQRVHKGHAEQSEVIATQFQEIRSGVWTFIGNGLSNQTFIEAPEGIIAIDTGESIQEMAAALRELRKITTAPIAAVIYTHFHYVEGTKAIFEEGNHVTPLPIYGHEKIAFNKARTLGEISPAYSRGIVEQFAVVMPIEGPDGNVNVGLGRFYKNPDHAPAIPGYVPVTHPLGERTSLTIAGLSVEAVHSPSDSDDSVNFYFQQIGTCVHNSVWPVLFNVYAIRGEEYRDPRILIPGIDNIIQWSPEYLVCAHGPGLAGKEKIREVATRYRDSIQYMWDQTVRGINKGWTMDEVATRVTLPELYDVDFYTSERYGVVEHHVRQIFMGLRGFFDGDESKLFPLEPQQRYTKLVKGFGGRAEVARQCEEALANEEIRWAVELGTWLVRSEGATQDERNLLAKCLRVVAERTPAANIRNWCITRARHLDGSFPMDRFNQHSFNPKFLSESTATNLVHTMRVLVEPTLIEGINHHIAFVIDGEEAGWHVRHSVIVPTNGWGAQSLVRMSRATFLTMIGGRLLWSDAVAAGDIVVTGSVDIVDQVRRAIENKGIAG